MTRLSPTEERAFYVVDPSIPRGLTLEQYRFARPFHPSTHSRGIVSRVKILLSRGA